MNESLYCYIQSTLYSYCTARITAKEARNLLNKRGVSVDLRQRINTNKIEIEFENKLYIVEV